MGTENQTRNQQRRPRTKKQPNRKAAKEEDYESQTKSDKRGP